MDDKAILGFFEEAKNTDQINETSLDQSFLHPYRSGEVNALLQKNKRRSKKDNAGRNYVCGCGKNYLSYPALYTHIKNKHDGVAPPNSTLQPQTRTRPGRPSKKYGIHGNTKIEPSAMSGSEEDNSNMDHNEDPYDLKSEKRSYMDNSQIYNKDKSNFGYNKDLNIGKFDKVRGVSFDPANLGNNVEENDFPFINDLNVPGKTSPTRNFLKTLNPVTNQYNLHALVDLINDIRNNNFINNNEDALDVITIDKVFSVLLIGLSKIATDEVYDMMCLIIRALRDCLNEIGYQIIEIYEQQNLTQKVDLNINKSVSNEESKLGRGSYYNSKFTEVETCQYVSLVFDYFVKEYFRKFISGEDFNVDFVTRFLFY